MPSERKRCRSAFETASTSPSAVRCDNIQIIPAESLGRLVGYLFDDKKAPSDEVLLIRYWKNSRQSILAPKNTTPITPPSRWPRIGQRYEFPGPVS
jgi:hypothetical protein